MDLEEIENEYNQELVNSNNFFLKGLKNKDKKEKLERKYKERLTDARERYYARVKKYLSEHKYKKEKKKSKDDKKEKKKDYDYRKNLKDKIIYNLKIFKFQLKIKTRQLRDHQVFQELFFVFKKIKVKIRHIYQNTRIKYSKIKSNSADKIEKRYNKTKDRVKQIKEKIAAKVKIILDKIKEKLRFILDKIKRKDKKEENKEATTPESSPQVN